MFSLSVPKAEVYQCLATNQDRQQRLRPLRSSIRRVRILGGRLNHSSKVVTAFGPSGGDAYYSQCANIARYYTFQSEDHLLRTDAALRLIQGDVSIEQHRTRTRAISKCGRAAETVCSRAACVRRLHRQYCEGGTQSKLRRPLWPPG